MPVYLHSGAPGHAGLLPEDTFPFQSTSGTSERTGRFDTGTTCWGESSCWWCACLPWCTLWSGADLVSSILFGTGVCSVTILSHHSMSYQGWTWTHSFHHSHMSQSVLNGYLNLLLSIIFTSNFSSTSLRLICIKMEKTSWHGKCRILPFVIPVHELPEEISKNVRSSYITVHFNTTDCNSKDFNFLVYAV